MTRPTADVVIVGDGPAGSALAGSCAARGLEVVVVGSGADWSATYGCWVDEFAPGAAPPFETVVDVAVVTDRRRTLARPYAVIDNRALHERLADSGPERVVGRAERVEPAGPFRTVVLADGSRLGARLVVDSTGWPSTLRDPTGVVPPAHTPATVAWQTALGVVLPEPPDGDLGRPTLMDLGGVRAPGGTSSSIGPAGVASFAYAVPVHDGWLVEETVLARRPAVEPVALLARLAARLGRHPDRLLGEAVRSEFVRIPMGAPITPVGLAVPFGASAGYIHPATGYSVAAGLRAVPRVTDAIVSSLGTGAGSGEERQAVETVWDAVWPTSLRRTRALHQLGLDVLLRLDADELAEFFDVFFDLPADRWATYLRIDATPRDTTAVMTELFRRSPWSLRRRLARVDPRALARLLRP